jgi:beta-N-acetylhexosaminidase
MRRGGIVSFPLSAGMPGSRRGYSRAGAAQAPLLLLLLALAACSGPSQANIVAHGIATARASASPTHAPTVTPPPIHPGPPDSAVMATANWYLDHMSLDEKLGQMMLVETVWTGYNGDVDSMVRGMHAGAMIIYNQNINSAQQLKGYLATIQANATIPLMVTMDEEGGVVNRLLTIDGPQPGAQDIAASGNPNEAHALGVTLAGDMKALGVNTDLAPVVDVRTTPAAIEYTRLYGDDPTTVERYAGAFMQGLQQSGVIACLKHWPGIGSVTLDPHETLPTITRSRSQLESTEFATFRSLLADQPGMVMVTHVIVTAIDPNLPATLSPALVTGVLRDELGFNGVVMTDSLYMKGISLHYSLGEAAVLSIIAGDDLLEGAWDSGSMAEMINAIKGALASGRISTARIDDSVRRILELKARYGLLPLRPYRPDTGASSDSGTTAFAVPTGLPADIALQDARWV